MQQHACPAPSEWVKPAFLPGLRSGSIRSLSMDLIWKRDCSGRTNKQHVSSSQWPALCVQARVCVCEPLLTSPCQPVIPGPRGKPLLGCTCSSSYYYCEKLLPLCSGLSHCYNGNGITRRKSQAKSKYNLQSYLLEFMLCRMLYAQCSCAGEPSNLHLLALGVSY